MDKFALEPMKKALSSLEKALHDSVPNEVERDGCIKRFEYTFELAWKTAKKALAYKGIVVHSPRDICRMLGQQEWITDLEKWLSFLDARNSTSHLYEDKVADEVFQLIPSFVQECHQLISFMEKILNETL